MILTKCSTGSYCCCKYIGSNLCIIIAEIKGHVFAVKQTNLQESCLGTFNFSDNNETIATRVATSPQSITITGNSSLVHAIPGVKTTLNIIQTDELGKNVGQFFPLSAKIASSDKCAKVHPDYLVITDNKLIIIGNPRAQGKLLLQSQSVKLKLDFQLYDCPPGHILNNSAGCEAQCKCFELFSNVSLSYNNLQCMPNGSVTIHVGYWAGYDNTSDPSQNTLYTGRCIVELLAHNTEYENVSKQPTNCSSFLTILVN